MVAWLNVQFTQLLLKAIISNKILCVRVRDSVLDSGFPAAIGPSGGLFPLSLRLGRSKARDGECPGFLPLYPSFMYFHHFCYSWLVHLQALWLLWAYLKPCFLLWSSWSCSVHAGFRAAAPMGRLVLQTCKEHPELLKERLDVKSLRNRKSAKGTSNTSWFLKSISQNREHFWLSVRGDPRW